MGGVTRPIFRNDQWQVTEAGIVSRICGAPYRYHIDAERLLAIERQLYCWPVHVVEMPWVKPELFFEAFEAAIGAHEGRCAGTVDTSLLQASFDEARRIAER